MLDLWGHVIRLHRHFYDQSRSLVLARELAAGMRGRLRFTNNGRSAAKINNLAFKIIHEQE